MSSPSMMITRSAKKRKPEEFQHQQPLVSVPVCVIDSARGAIVTMLEKCRQDHRKKEWNKLAEFWKSDAAVALAFLTGNRMDDDDDDYYDGWIGLADLPPHLLTDRTFLYQAVKKRNRLWMELPQSFQIERAFLNVLTRFSQPLLECIFERFPWHQTDRKLWKRIIVHGGTKFIEQFAPECIRMDQELMLKAFMINQRCVDVMHPSLFDKKDFVRGILACPGWSNLQYIPQEAQLKWPDLVIAYFHDIFKYDLRGRLNAISLSHVYFHYVNPALWNNDHFKYEWFRAGGLYLSRFPPEWIHDRKLALAMVAGGNMHASIHMGLPNGLPREYTQSKEFMIEAVQLDPQAYPYADESILRDFELIVTAMAHWNEGDLLALESIHDSFLHCHRGRIDFLEEVWQEINSKLDARESFFKQILPAIMLGGGPTCHLSKLSQGIDVTGGFLRDISGYLGVPRGDFLDFLEVARENFPPPEKLEEYRHESTSSSSSTSESENSDTDDDDTFW